MIGLNQTGMAICKTVALVVIYTVHSRNVTYELTEISIVGIKECSEDNLQKHTLPLPETVVGAYIVIKNKSELDH